MKSALLVTLAAALLAAAPASPAGGTHPFRLDNGLTGVLVEDHANPFIALTAVVGAGSIDEPHGTAGASHFLEHLLFNGTERMSQEELYEAVDRIGAYSNAATRPDHTVFLMLAPSRHAEEAMRIQSDMLFRSTLPPHKFEKERGIVSEEIRKDRDRESYRVGLLLDQELHAGTLLAVPVLGTAEDIEGLSRETVWTYYRARYVPENVVLLVVGDVTPADLEKSLAVTFGTAPRRKGPERRAFRLDLPEGASLTTLPAEGRRTHVAAVLPGPEAGSLDAVALSILVDQWNRGEFSAGPRPVLSAGLHTLRGTTYLGLSGDLGPGRPPGEVLDDARGDLRKAASARQDRKAVERAVRAARVTEAGFLEKPHYYGFMRADQIAAAGIEAALGRIDALQGIGPADLEAAAGRWFGGGTLRAVAAGPGLEAAELALAPLPPPAGKGAPAVEAASGAVTVRKVLPNGLVVLVETAPAGHMAAFHLVARDRTAREPEGREGIADLLHRLLPEGTRNRGGGEFQEAIDGLGAAVKVTDNPWIPYDDYYFTTEFSYVRMEVLAEDALAALALLADMVLAPALEPEAVERERNLMLQLVAKRSGEARHAARAVLRQALFGRHPKTGDPLGSEESLAAITREDLVAFHASYLAPDNLILSVVSPLPAPQVLGAVKQLFGSARPACPPLAVPPLPGSLPGERRRLAEVGREQSILYLGKLLETPDEEWPALLAANAVLSERLAFNLRESKGLAYVVGSSVRRGRYGAWFTATVGTAPEQVAEAERLIREEMSRLPKGLGERELERAVGRLTGRALMRRLPSISRAFYLGLAELEGRPLGHDLEVLARLGEVTPREARRAAKAWLQPEAMAVVEAR